MLPVETNLPSNELTPVMEQYLAIKEQHKDTLLFYRMGDFYELFYSDAEIAAKELNIVLTKKQVKGQNIPMCGVPCHAYENYLNRLIKAGFKVAVCEQLETPEEAKKRGIKAVIRREVLRIITPGTITEDALLPTDSFNYLAAIFINHNIVSIAWVDISTGNFYVESSNIKELCNILARISPKEIIINEKQQHYFKDDYSTHISLNSHEKFNFISSQKALEAFYNGKLFKELKEAEVVVCGVLLNYVMLTQKNSMPKLLEPKIWNEANSMRMDFFTRQSLELTNKISGGEQGSLKATLNKTVTKSGSRLLKEWINSPVLDLKTINQRLEAVEYFVNNPELLKNSRNTLKNTADLIRILGRLSLNRGGPKDLLALKQGLHALVLFRNQLIGKQLPELLEVVLHQPKDFSHLLDTLNRAILDSSELPLTIKDGGFIRHGFKSELDLLKSSKQTIIKKINLLQEAYIMQTGINNLKIQYNNLMGYFIDVPSRYANKLLENSNFIHKQTLSTSARFSSNELLSTETELMRTKEQALNVEQDIFNEIVKLALTYKDIIFDAGESIAILDVLTTFATLVFEYDLVKPTIDNSQQLNIVAGRHLAVEQGLKKQLDSKFVPNDCVMDNTGNIFLITGPNMAGKSTFLRQNAIIIILAQIGCFVPAKSAHIGIVDAIFSRVGAGDNLYSGQSTFMVEMLETAVILNNATSKSFVILDEIGRGTATYDGLSIAFAVMEYLHEVNKSRTLFATHYHELTKLKEKLKNIKLYNMEVKSEQNNLVFMHKVIAGTANKSYGIHAAKLAGMPAVVINKASKVLAQLENSNSNNIELPLFNEVIELEQVSYPTSNNNLIIDQLAAVDIDTLTPKAALDFLYKLKAEVS